MASAAFNIAQEEKKKADDLATQDAYIKIAQAKNRLFWDPKTGAMSKRGKDAFGVVDEYSASFDKEADEIEKGLVNQDQKGMFQRMRAREKQELDGQLQRHLFGEIKTFDDETTRAGIATTRDEAVLNYQDPSKIEKSLMMQKSFLLSHAERQGFSAEATQLLVQSETSKTQSAIVSRMLANGEDLKAKEYFQANRDSFTGSDTAAIEKDLEEGSLRGDSQRTTDQIVAKHGGLTSALGETRKIEDPKLRDAVESRVKDFFQTRKAADNEFREQNFRQAANMLEQNKGDLDKVPPRMWNSMSMNERQAMEQRAQQLREGRPAATDWNQYYDLKTIASSSATRDKFLTMNLMTVRPNMADTQFKELVDIQTSLRNQDGKADKELDGFRSDMQLVEDSIPTEFKKDNEKVALFKRRVEEEQVKLQERTGKKATNAEMQSIVDSLLIKGVTEKGFFIDTKKRVFELAGNEQFAIDAKDVPKDERTKIEAALKRRGQNVSDDKILELYLRKVRENMVSRGSK